MQDFAPTAPKSGVIAGCMQNEVDLSEMQMKPRFFFNNSRIRRRNEKYFKPILKRLKHEGITKSLLIDLAWLDKYMRAREMIAKSEFPGGIHISYVEAIPDLDIHTSAICYEIVISEGIEIKIMINADINKDSPIIVKWEITTIMGNGNKTTSSAEAIYDGKISNETSLQKGGGSGYHEVVRRIPEMVKQKMIIMLSHMQWRFACGFMDFSYDL